MKDYRGWLCALCAKVKVKAARHKALVLGHATCTVPVTVRGEQETPARLTRIYEQAAAGASTGAAN
jgi:hypothetical protein